eukprot:gnl/TRDRNA2_/TRDRNA2_30668_c0_seq1.p1 gnl/TRDRNA2_/TRDRNA2_30668_c0~~gnl/TRDRNA2_/TRDRNA2_30668_c0_seq1.p1  ORF type:complete len:388 (+),score=59.20 gnl/TRDRNA2_/TRDRNA2_30668_c0_seq1:48-1211(+)
MERLAKGGFGPARCLLRVSIVATATLLAAHLEGGIASPAPAPPLGHWRCWVTHYGVYRSLGERFFQHPGVRMDEWCCRRPATDLACWDPPFSKKACCEIRPVVPRRCSRDDPQGHKSISAHQSSKRTVASKIPTAAEDLESPCASLDEIGQWFAVSPRGGGADKHLYFHDFYRYYQSRFERLGDSAHVLEVGVLAGNSLAVWGTWFPNGTVIGVDLDTAPVKAHWPVLAALGANASGNIHFAQTDLSVPGNLSWLMTERRDGEQFDLVIDDAAPLKQPHAWQLQITLFETLFPTAVKPGGLYIVEDAVHAEQLVAYFGALAQRHIWLDWVAAVYNDGPLVERGRRESEDWRDQVAAVEFRRNIIVVEKHLPFEYHDMGDDPENAAVF